MGRRGENIRKRADGRWEARVVQGAPVNGKTNYKYLYGKTDQEVRQKKEAFVCKLRSRDGSFSGQERKEERPTIQGEAMEHPSSMKNVVRDWLNSKKPSIKESTYAYYTTMTENHIVSALGDLCVKDVTTAVLSDFLMNRKTSGRIRDGKPLADKTIADLKAILKQILTYAQMRGLIECAPACPAAPAKQQPVSVLTKAEQDKLEELLCAEDDAFSLGVFVSLYGGPRIGEVCALKWEDFDFENETIRISKTVSRIRDVESTSDAKTKVVITSPKTENSVRTIPLPAPVFSYLKERRREGEMYVITGTEKYLEPRVCRARYKRLLKRAGIADHTWHCLRHTFATRCVESGVDFKSLSEIMGHSDVKITMQRYVHPSMDFKKEQVNKLPCFMESGQ